MALGTLGDGTTNATHERIRSEIAALVSGGTPIEEVLVNDGNDRWGDSCAVSLAATEAFFDEWERQGLNPDLGELFPAADWLRTYGGE